MRDLDSVMLSMNVMRRFMILIRGHAREGALTDIDWISGYPRLPDLARMPPSKES